MSAYIAMKLVSLGHILNDEKLRELINILNQSIVRLQLYSNLNCKLKMYYNALNHIVYCHSLDKYNFVGQRKVIIYIESEVNCLERITARNVMYL